mmetsp:Transcript_42212/g.62072  ORF Transcript_42212/g.62072 Transcript_42212/m.62072 type:complete len:439 (+) Transcript_42212:68-1384(+)
MSGVSLLAHSINNRSRIARSNFTAVHLLASKLVVPVRAKQECFQLVTLREFREHKLGRPSHTSISTNKPLQTVRAFRAERMGANLSFSSVGGEQRSGLWMPSAGLLISMAFIGLSSHGFVKTEALSSQDPPTSSVQAIKGHRPYMEDDHAVAEGGHWCAVFDGHGGAQVARFLQRNLHARFRGLLPPGLDLQDCDIEMVKDCLAQSYEYVDQEVQKVAHWQYQGSTAVCVVALREALVAANVGDSRAVLSRRGRALDLTEDHKPDNPKELERIKSLGGNVKWYGYLDQDGNPVDGTGVYRVNGNLAVARAVGDRKERPFVSGAVDVRHFPRDEEGDQFVILASDGLWDVMSSEEAVGFVHAILQGQVGALRAGGHPTRGPQPRQEITMFDWTQRYGNDRGLIRAAMLSRKRKMARYLAEEALRRGTGDNITVIVMWLQ